MTTTPHNPEAVEAAIKWITKDIRNPLCTELVRHRDGDIWGETLSAARILTTEIERLRVDAMELNQQTESARTWTTQRLVLGYSEDGVEHSSGFRCLPKDEAFELSERCDDAETWLARNIRSRSAMNDEITRMRIEINEYRSVISAILAVSAKGTSTTLRTIFDCCILVFEKYKGDHPR